MRYHARKHHGSRQRYPNAILKNRGTLRCHFALLSIAEKYAPLLRLTRIIAPSSNYFVIIKKIGLLIPAA